MLGNTLKLIREANYMSVGSVSKETNLPISLIEDIEIGKSKVSLSTLDKLSELYQIPVSKILLLNDFGEHFGVSDEQLLENIKTHYELTREFKDTFEKRMELK